MCKRRSFFLIIPTEAMHSVCKSVCGASFHTQNTLFSIPMHISLIVYWFRGHGNIFRSDSLKQATPVLRGHGHEARLFSNYLYSEELNQINEQSDASTKTMPATTAKR